MALSGNGINGATLTHLLIENSHYGMKIGSGAQSQGIQADGLIFRHAAEPLFLADVSDSTFTNLDIQADRYSNNQWHGIYMERDLHNITIRDSVIRGGSGYTVQMYYSGGGSSGILFENVTIDAREGRYPLVIWGYSNVTFRNVTLLADPASDGAIVRLHGTATNILFDGFTASGGSALVRPYSGQNPVNVIFRNGTYDGPTLGSGATFENVSLR